MLKLMPRTFVTIYLVLIGVCCLAQKRDTIRSMITSTVDGVKYQAIYYSNYNLIIRKANGKPILTFKGNDPELDLEGFNSFYFTDFNHDGYKDIRITHYSNVPGIDDLLLYDKHTRTFQKLKEFDQFPSAVSLPHTHYYYSYHRSGCADSNWDSDLFKSVNYRAIKMGNIKGLECREKEGIFITRIKGNIVKPHQQLPISTIHRYKDYKWGFIRDYWLHHYKEFR